MGPIVGVVGGRGGVGASLLTAVLAAVGARRGYSGRSILVDLEAVAGGIDVLLGVEGVPGARWSGLRLGGGYLQPSLLTDALPLWGPVSILAADIRPSPESVAQLLAVAGSIGPVVVELGRWSGPARSAALRACDVVCLLSRCDVASVTAARSVAIALLADGLTAPLGIVLRRSRQSPTPLRVAELVGADLIATLPASDGWDSSEPLLIADLPRAMVRVATGVWDALLTPNHRLDGG